MSELNWLSIDSAALDFAVKEEKQEAPLFALSLSSLFSLLQGIDWAQFLLTEAEKN